MGKKYKIVISSGNINREAELPDEDISVRVGTTVRCDIRIAQTAAKEALELEMTRQAGVWAIECPEGIYFTDGGLRKQIRKQLEHGDKISVFLQSQAKSICTISFMLDFDSRAKRYDRVIDVRNVNNLVIGGHPSAGISIEDPLLEGDFITISKRQGKLYLADFSARYGAYINGIRVDGEKELKDTDFFSVVGYSFYYKDGFLYTDSENGIHVNGMRSFFDGVYSGNMQYPKFVRNVRKKIVLSEEEISVLDPPQKPQKPKDNILMQLLPAIGSLVLVVVLRGVMGGGGSFVLFSACSMALGMVTTVISFITGNKDYRKEIEEREREYSAYIARKRQEIETARKMEAQQLSQIYIPAQQQLKRVREFSGDLFDRQKEDKDFLCVRLGEGRQEAKRPIKVTVKESITTSDDMAQIPQKIADEYKYIANAPIVLDMKNVNAVGVVGDELRQIEMLKIMTLDLATRHYFSDVKLLYVLGDQIAQRLSWLRWLPHVENEALGIHNIICDEDSKNTLFEFLFVELSAREQQKRNQPQYIVFVMDDKGMKSHPMSKYINTAKEYGFVFVFFETRQDLLPQGCDEVVSLERGSNHGTLMKVSNVNDTRSFTYAPVRDENVEQMAITLSPVYSEEVSLENSLTKNISLYEMLGIYSPEDIDLQNNWHRAAVYRSLAAPLGVKTGNELVYLDLHEKAHGPHGLVAGTTGSGKSELLQSYIISAAILFHPYEVGFVIIDFKGGGMANQFRGLPHLMGAITNIDGAAIQRSLKSIKAEMLKRQRLFDAYGVSKIDDYIKLYKNGRCDEPLPHLIIVVDEFAELKAQQPEFMNELISAARIGRSLGVHLILATQKPAGQVNEQIWSNSKFKLCLKVATPQDSNEVIKSPLAAEIREPGRAYLQVGNNEIFELFQSAYSGGPAGSSEEHIKEFAICELSLAGWRNTVFEQTNKNGEKNSGSQLDLVVSYISEHCKDKGIAKLPDICLPDIPEILDFQVNEQNVPSEVMQSAIGIYDDPDQQYQGSICIDHASENLLLVGSSQMGKTNLLQVIVRSLVERYSPTEVSIYILDFGSMILRSFDEMAHIGGVVCSMEDEKLKNLFKLLYEEVEIRKHRLMEIGVSSFVSYRAAGYSDLPLIVVLVDNFTALKELYFQEEDLLLPLLRDGLSMGISVVLANSQISGISYKYISNFSRRLAFFCNDSNEYSSVMDGRPRIAPRACAGRAIVNIGNQVYEMQTYLSFPGEKEIERVNNMRAFVDTVNRKYPGQRARRIPLVPKVLDEETFRNEFGINRSKTYVVPIGVRYEPVEVLSFDLRELSVLSVMGGRPGDRENILRVLVNQLDQNIFSCPTEMYVVDDIQHSLRWLESYGVTREYTANPNGIIDYLDLLSGRIKERFDAVVEEGPTALENESLLVLVIQNRDAIQILGKNAASMGLYKELVSTYRAMKICVIYTDLEDANVAFNSPEVLKLIKDNRRILYLNRLSSMKFIDVPLAVSRKFRKDLGENEAYWIAGEEIGKIKFVKP